MIRILMIIFVGFLVDFVFYGVNFRFFPLMNAKMMMAVAGVGIMAWEVIRTRRYQVSKDVVICAGISALYSILNLIAVEYNETYDYSYANYITSFFTWLFSGYTAMWVMRWVHGRATISLLTAYLAAVSAAQCILALLMDNYEFVKSFVNSIHNVATDFYHDIDRLYGFGFFALDPAGVRMGIVLVMIVFVLLVDEQVRSSGRAILWYMLSFLIIAGIGNIVSRTTTVGLGLSTLALGIGSGVWQLRIQRSSVKLFNYVLWTIVLAIPLFMYLYNTSDYFYYQFRYGFEGFFNWVERGEWTTGSTEKLNSQMWIWPDTLRGWIIGNGLYGGFLYDTDIGYCRLILYSGILGFGTFALMFIYLPLSFMRQYPRYAYMFLMICALGFIVWIKASTDIFVIWCFLLFLDGDPEYNPNAKHIIS